MPEDKTLRQTWELLVAARLLEVQARQRLLAAEKQWRRDRDAYFAGYPGYQDAEVRYRCGREESSWTPDPNSFHEVRKRAFADLAQQLGPQPYEL